MFYMYYSREGKPLSRDESLNAWRDSKPVARAELDNGLLVSTVFLCINHAHGEGPPLIFETMVFDGEKWGDPLTCVRYSTEAEALKGHDKVVEEFKNWAKPVRELELD